MSIATKHGDDLNRLSGLLWLTGRLLRLRAGVDANMRDAAHKGTRWSRAW
jgi:hypothetical protein